jgi:hypothetical protein
MAGWMAPFLLQTMLILFGNSRLHRLPGQLMTSSLGLR